MGVIAVELSSSLLAVTALLNTSSVFCKNRPATMVGSLLLGVVILRGTTVGTTVVASVFSGVAAGVLIPLMVEPTVLLALD
jgi:hypothetical protein